MIPKRNNRGFSLVELIIVIAIMAILIGVLAPAYLRYVEKSRKSADADAIAACLNAIETVVIDPEYAEQIDTDTRITLHIKEENNDAVLEFTAIKWAPPYPDLDGVKKTLNSIIGRYALKSRDWKAHINYNNYNDNDDYIMDLLYAAVTENGHVKYTLEDFEGADTKLADYSPSLKAKIENSIINSNK